MVFRFIIQASAALTTEGWLSSWTTDDLFRERLLALWARFSKTDLFVCEKKEKRSPGSSSQSHLCVLTVVDSSLFFSVVDFSSGHSVQFVCVCAGLCQHFLCCNTGYSSFVVVLIVGGFLLPTPWLWWTLFSVTIRAKSFLACFISW